MTPPEKKIRSLTEAFGSPDAGEKRALDELFSLAYEELKHIASYMRRNEPNGTLNSTALVHEAFLRLKDSPRLAVTSELHFKAIAARAMRRILVDAARRRHSLKRGGAAEVVFITFNDHADNAASYHIEVLAIDMALSRMEALDARQARIFECRFFSGLSVAETAEALGVSTTTVEREWRAAKAWLAIDNRPGKE